MVCWSFASFLHCNFLIPSHIFCSFSHLLDHTALRDIENTLDWLLDIQAENGNFATDVEEIGLNRGSNELVHWCHGATGAVHLMIVAYLCTKKAKFLKVC